MGRAWYEAKGAEFAVADPKAVFGELTQNCPFDLVQTQSQSWDYQIAHLQSTAAEFPDAHFFLEFSIPRMGRRADAVVVAQGIIFVIEYKVGERAFPLSAIEQTHGYALDLKNFHETSHLAPIVPILVATKAAAVDIGLGLWPVDAVHPPVRSSAEDLAAIIRQFVSARPCASIDAVAWAAGAYRPTPTIIEAAQALYGGHTVSEISRSDAEDKNLTLTTRFLDGVIARAEREGRKAICFVTGVPGAGKTLVGLNLACRQMNGSIGRDATYLSGNGPLVKVLRKALMLDWKARQKGLPRPSRAAAERESHRVETLIQNVHHFRDDGLRDMHPPSEQVVIFDEAQRAWTKEQTSSFMRRKRNQQDFDQSEPAFLLSVMDRRNDWCVVVCLVGEGQEINTGEAGIVEWLDALVADYRDWDVYLPGRLLTEEYGVSRDVAYRAGRLNAFSDDSLHLEHSMRSFRAREVASFVSEVLDGSKDPAAIKPSGTQYPIVRTRDIDTARDWLKARRRATERTGMLASSNALRLKPEGLHVRTAIDECNWFLNPADDVRGSSMLEDVATEFQVQGLEIDWACVCWDLNLYRKNDRWVAQEFRGTKWQRIDSDRDGGTRARYVLNSYRVLLTRARQGMVIFVPRGDAADATRPPAAYDAVDRWFAACGVPLL